MKVLSIDSSINNVGWTLFKTHNGMNPIKEIQRAWKWGTWYPTGGSLEARILDICQKIIVEINGFDILVTEKPAFYSSEKGQIAARQNYTIDLAAINYFIAGFFHKDHRTHYAITAMSWKGSVAKEITQKLFFKRFRGRMTEKQMGSVSEHSVDSTMMLRYWLETIGMHEPRFARKASPELLQRLL